MHFGPNRNATAKRASGWAFLPTRWPRVSARARLVHHDLHSYQQVAEARYLSQNPEALEIVERSASCIEGAGVRAGPFVRLSCPAKFIRRYSGAHNNLGNALRRRRAALTGVRIRTPGDLSELSQPLTAIISLHACRLRRKTSSADGEESALSGAGAAAVEQPFEPCKWVGLVKPFSGQKAVRSRQKEEGGREGRSGPMRNCWANPARSKNCSYQQLLTPFRRIF